MNLSVVASRRRSRPCRPALLVVLAALVAGAVAPTARAHATLVRSVPADAATVPAAPREMQLWFSEPISARFSSARLFDAKHRSVPLTAHARSRLLSLVVPRLPRGAYSLDWQILSEDDVHLSRGSLAFAVGRGSVPAAARRDPAGADPSEVVFTWLSMALLASLVGALAVAGLVLEPEIRREGTTACGAALRRARLRVLRLGVWCGVQALLLYVLLLGWQITRVADSLPGASPLEAGGQLLGGTRWGTLWLLREVSLVALVGLILLLLSAERTDRAGHRRWWRPSVAATALLVLVLAGVQALGSHAAGLDSSRAPALVADALHLLAAGVWFGGLLALALVILSGVRHATTASAAVARACLRRFALLAALSVATLAVTGLFAAAQQVPSIEALTATLYGRALLAKTGLLLAAGALGLTALIMLRLRLAAPSRPALRRLPTIVAAEAGVGLLVLLAVGVLTASPPPRGRELASGPSSPLPLTRSVDDLLVTLSVKPSEPGPNIVTVRAVSTRRPAPAEIARVLVRFGAPEGSVPSVAVAREVGPGLYRLGGEQLELDGRWRIEAVVQRPGLADGIASFDWAVGTAAAPRAAGEARPLRAPLTRAAGALLLVLVGGLAWLALARGRPRPARPSPLLAVSTPREERS